MDRIRLCLVLAAVLTVSGAACADGFDVAAVEPFFRDSVGERVDAPTPGEELYLCLTVSCVGSGAPPPVRVEVFFDDDLLGGGDVSLQCGITEEVHFDDALAFSAGEHSVLWVVDAFDDLSEPDEENNLALIEFDGLPVMRVEPTALHFDETLPDAAAPAEDMDGAGVSGPDAQSAEDAEGVPVVIWLKQQGGVAMKPRPGHPRDRREWVRRLKRLRAGRQKNVLRRILKLRNLGVSRVRPKWIVNAIGARVRPNAIRRIRKLDGVAEVFVDEPLTPADAVMDGRPPSESTPDIGWGVERMRVPQVWEEGFTGNGVVVAVIDTGVNYNHDDLAGRMWRNAGEIPDNGIDDDGNGYVDDIHGFDFSSGDSDPMDEFGHGTHVAGLIAGDGTAGTMTGVAPGARLMALRAVPTGFSDFADAIEYALANGADMLSMSAGWKDPSDWVKSSTRYLAETVHKAGLLWVVSAGNGKGGGQHYPPPGDIIAPADTPSPTYGETGRNCVLAIGATTVGDEYASFSGVGPTSWYVTFPYGYHDYPYPSGLKKPDLCAPGSSIKSCSHNDIHGYRYLSGTSMAAPHAAGVVALMLSRNPHLTPFELASALEAGAVDLGDEGRDNHFGVGRVDALDAMAAIPDPPVAETMTIHNDGDVDLIISDISKRNSAEWLFVSPSRFPIVVPPGGQRHVFVQVDPNGLTEGSHVEYIDVFSNDPGANPLPEGLEVTVDVPSAPEIGVDNHSMNLEANKGDTDTQVVEVFNAGGGELTWATAVSTDVLKVAPASGSSTGDNTAVEVTVDTSLLDAGGYIEYLVIDSPYAGVAPVVIDIHIDVLLEADVNKDGCVNVVDLLKVRSSLGMPREDAAPPRCDVNSDGEVGVTDLLTVRNNFGAGPYCP